MLSKLISYFLHPKCRKSTSTHSDLLTNHTQVEDTQATRLNRNFKHQINDLRVMSLVPHALDCPDIFECKKNPCIAQEPMKITKSKKKAATLQIDIAEATKKTLEELKPIIHDDLGNMKEFLQSDD